ncbi:MAG TPA: acyclic terpene utilization AtuA family protein [Thermoanaerobaculia bacterium]|nr:acyclic terpene utilization AtuA family protein [Thermoanaerobaculia bacterium]
MSDDGVLRVANCSGFYGDRLAAAREMVEDGPIDVLTGDYLAELTLMILLKDKLEDPSLGYARTFLRQLQEVARTCLERGIRIVVNAGGLNPAGLADAARRLYESQGLDAAIAFLDGDDLLSRLDDLMSQGEALAHLDRGTPLRELDQQVLSANAYLGGAGIAEALRRGADLVVCPRVTDAALAVGPAMWRFGWARDDWDRLAAAVVAGHVIECGAQCTGGNYSFFEEVPSLEHPGFPIAELYEDGSFVITKHPGTDGLVSVGTVTAQLLYEIAGPRYANPDVVARFDTIRLEQQGPDRVRVWGVRGEPAPEATKVCINYLGGYKNGVTFLLPGLDAEGKARVAEESFWTACGGRERFAETYSRLLHGARSTSDSDGDAISLLRLAARDPDERKVGRPFWNAAIETALGSYPGFQLASSSRTASAITVYWPALVASRWIAERVHVAGETVDVPPAPGGAEVSDIPAPEVPAPEVPPGEVPAGPTRLAPLGAIAGARSGDKGGHANVGFWTRTPEAWLWLERFLTPDQLRDLYPEAADLEIERFELPNLLALNFVIHGLLGEGVSASLRLDPQAKMLGEELRAARVPIPASLLSG